MLAAADARRQLDADGLELQAECARWLGRRAEIAELLERAHHAYGDDLRAAARTALAPCLAHADSCEASLAASWWWRADELVQGLPEGPEHGLHAWYEGRFRSDAGDAEGHERCARRALEIAGRCERHPLLGRYLENTIRTGVACRFEPDPGRPVVWWTRERRLSKVLPMIARGEGLNDRYRRQVDVSARCLHAILGFRLARARRL